MKKLTKSPAKILPAPVPVGDQQQGGGGQRIMLKQGGVLTSISSANQMVIRSLHFCTCTIIINFLILNSK